MASKSSSNDHGKDQQGIPVAFRQRTAEESRRTHAVPSGIAEPRPGPQGEAEDGCGLRLRASGRDGGMGGAGFAARAPATKPDAGFVERWPEHGIPLAP